MDTCRVIQVIETTLTRRGKGIEGDPIRTIRQYWSMDGKLLAEVDPCKDTYDESTAYGNDCTKGTCEG